MMRKLLVALLVLTTLAAQARERISGTSREAEISSCLVGEINTWNDGRDQPAIAPQLFFVYDHAGAPAWFPQALVLADLQRAAAAWSECGVPAKVLAPGAVKGSPPGLVRVAWYDAGSHGNFGQADTGRRTLSLGREAFRALKARAPNYPAEQALQTVISHEMGHLFGLLAHSRRCVDVMSYYNDGKGNRCRARNMSLLSTLPEYRSDLPTACDIERCRMVNGK